MLCRHKQYYVGFNYWKHLIAVLQIVRMLLPCGISGNMNRELICVVIEQGTIHATPCKYFCNTKAFQACAGGVIRDTDR